MSFIAFSSCFTIQNKKNTHNVESINADLRHYIPVLARRSRYFARKIETLYAVAAVFISAYNRLGLAKYKNIASVNIMVNCLFQLSIFFNNAFSHSKFFLKLEIYSFICYNINKILYNLFEVFKMALISMTCPSCNGEIQIDNSKEFAFCMYCGKRFILKNTAE